MSKLSCEQLGQGSPLVLLHGWGLNGAVWHGISEQLAAHHRLYLFDLPGFGDSAFSGQLVLEDMAKQVAEQVGEPAIWLGWSMGGLVAMQAALSEPESVSALVTVASSPHFMQQQQWPGIAPKVLAGFAHGLEQDYAKTLQQFLAIQAMGSEHAKQDIKQLRSLLSEKPLPQPEALRQGLELLKNTDLREQVASITVPWLQLYGRKDSLVPKAAKEQHRQYTPKAKQHCFDGASHAPFISDKQAFCEELLSFTQALV